MGAHYDTIVLTPMIDTGFININPLIKYFTMMYHHVSTMGADKLYHIVGTLNTV
jgi:hypothetical protein